MKTYLTKLILQPGKEEKIEKEVIDKNDSIGKMIIEYAKKNKMDVISLVLLWKNISFGSMVKEVGCHL